MKHDQKFQFFNVSYYSIHFPDLVSLKLELQNWERFQYQNTNLFALKQIF
jgi:hypothetical protein